MTSNPIPVRGFSCVVLLLTPLCLASDEASMSADQRMPSLNVTAVVSPASGQGSNGIKDQCCDPVPEPLPDRDLADLKLQGSRLLNAGQYSQAELLFRRAIGQSEQQSQPGVATVELAGLLENLGITCARLGRYPEAEEVHLRALSMLQRLVGMDHPDTVNALNNLAAVYLAQQQYQKAETALLQAGRSSTSFRDGGQLIQAATLSTLGSTYLAEGRKEDAGEAFQQALRLREAVLGPEHPDVAVTLNDLGVLYQSEGLTEQAVTLLERSLRVTEQALGTQHPRLAKVLNNLGVLYATDQQFARAEAAFRRALSIDERSLPPEHRDVLHTAASLAEVYMAQRRKTEGERMYEQILPGLERAFGPESIELVKALGSLAEAYRADGRYARADPLYRRELAILSKRPGLATGATRREIEHYQDMLRKRGGKRKPEKSMASESAFLPR